MSHWQLDHQHPLVQKIQSNRLMQHLLFWFTFLVFIVITILQRNPADLSTSIIRDLFHFSITVFAVYFNREVLFPRIFIRGRYFTYLFALAASMVLISAGACTMNVLVLKDLMMHSGETFTPTTTMVFFSFLFPQIFFISITMLLHFIKEWMAVRDLELKYHSAEEEKLSAQLHSLKAQINPHFLFNTLNNIYSHSLYSDPATPQLILQLSDLLNYIIYECDGEKVPLNRELEFIRRYIELERLRIDDSIRIELDICEPGESFAVAPLLFLPLIENAFKHGKQVEAPDIFFSLSIRVEAQNLIFKLVNRVEDSGETAARPGGGIGISNVRRRLELLYPGRYTFTCDIRGGNFHSELHIVLGE